MSDPMHCRDAAWAISVCHERGNARVLCLAPQLHGDLLGASARSAFDRTLHLLREYHLGATWDWGAIPVKWSWRLSNPWTNRCTAGSFEFWISSGLPSKMIFPSSSIPIRWEM